MQFERKGKSSAQVSIRSIQDIYLGTEDKQIGGIPMTLGEAAVPFEGGRAISLFSHKQYDTFTVEYLDNKRWLSRCHIPDEQRTRTSLREGSCSQGGAHRAARNPSHNAEYARGQTPEVKHENK
jgi:hypothetical protein